jgi:hypothetical protein
MKPGTLPQIRCFELLTHPPGRRVDDERRSDRPGRSRHRHALDFESRRQSPRGRLAPGRLRCQRPELHTPRRVEPQIPGELQPALLPHGNPCAGLLHGSDGSEMATRRATERQPRFHGHRYCLPAPCGSQPDSRGKLRRHELAAVPPLVGASTCYETPWQSKWVLTIRPLCMGESD